MENRFNYMFNRLTLEFEGSCDCESCYAAFTTTGTLMFGSGEFDGDSWKWENPCDVCNIAWHKQYGYLIGLSVWSRFFILTDPQGKNLETVHFDQEQIEEIKKASNLLLFLVPFQNWIKAGLGCFINVARFAEKSNNFADNYTNKKLTNRNKNKELNKKYDPYNDYVGYGDSGHQE